MKTWKQLEDMASSDKLRLLITRVVGAHHLCDGVSVYSAIGLKTELLTITVADLTAEDGDLVIRKTLETALRGLRDLGPG